MINGMVCFKKLTIPFKLLTLLVTFTLLLEITARICALMYKNNIAVMHIMGLTEYILFSLTFYYLFKSKIVKASILVSIVIISIFFFINALLLQPYNRVFPSNIVLPSEIAYTIFSLLLFKQMLQYPLQINIIKQSIFWYNTAILFFSTTMFLNLGLINYYIKHRLNDGIIHDFTLGINVIFYVLIGISILMNSKEITFDNG